MDILNARFVHLAQYQEWLPEIVIFEIKKFVFAYIPLPITLLSTVALQYALKCYNRGAILIGMVSLGYQKLRFQDPNSGQKTPKFPFFLIFIYFCESIPWKRNKIDHAIGKNV